MRQIIHALFLGVLAALSASASAQPLTTAFTFQGELDNSGSPVSGTYDFKFTLFDAPSGGSQVGPQLCADNVTVTNGKMTVQLDFGAQFAGAQRFLEVWTRPDTGLTCSNASGFTILGPRQSLTAAPNAVFSLNATNAATLNNQPASFYTNASNLTGTLADAQLSSNIPRLNLNDSFTGNLGVGITGAPAARLQIDGAESSGNGVGAGIRIDNTASGGGTWFLRAGATGTNTPAGGFSIADAVGYRLVIDNSGRVGIGTATPSSLLEVQGAAPQLRLRNNADQGGGYVQDTSSAMFFGFYNPGATQWGIVPAGGLKSVFAVQNQGLVASAVESPPGSGNYAARNILDDGSGNATFTGTTSVAALSASGTASFLGLATFNNPTTFSSGVSAGFVNVDPSGLATSTGSFQSQSNVLRFGLTPTGQGIASKATSGGNQFGLDFYTGNSARLSISNGGNVGIGTTTPSAPLDIEGAAPTVRLHLTGDPGSLDLRDFFNGGFTFSFTNTSGSTWGTVPANSTRNYFLVTNSGQVGSLRDDGSQSLFRNYLDDGAGNARIDTLNQNTGTIANTLRLGGGTEGIGSKRDSGGNQYGLDFYTNSTARLSVANGGNVGIGTTTPTANLEVSGAAPVVHVRNTADQGGAYVQDNNSSMLMGFYNPGASAWGAVPANGSKAFFEVTNTGAVGSVFEVPPGSGSYSLSNILDDGSANSTIGGALTIGASATAQSFLASNAVAVDSTGLATSTGTFQSQPHVLRFGAAPTGEGITSKRTSGGNQFGLDLYTGNSPRLSISNSGNVGIGTTSPSTKLDLRDGTFNLASSSGGYAQLYITSNHNPTMWFYNASNFAVAVIGESQMAPTLGGQVVVCNSSGTAVGGFQVTANGQCTMFSQVKNFVVPNPDDNKTDLYYACVEGPEAAMYCRGTARLDAGHATVDLPRHFAAMAADSGITVQITPLSADCMGIAVTRKSPESFDVAELLKGQTTCDFDWEVKAVRKGYEDYQVVRPASLRAPRQAPLAAEEAGSVGR